MSLERVSWAWKLPLPTATKLVLLAIADHANEDGFCWPGVVRIATKCNLSERSVQRHIRVLVARGFLQVEERHRPDGSQSSNLYHLPTVSPGGDNGVTSRCQGWHPLNRQITNN